MCRALVLCTGVRLVLVLLCVLVAIAMMSDPVWVWCVAIVLAWCALSLYPYVSTLVLAWGVMVSRVRLGGLVGWVRPRRGVCGHS